MDGSYCWWCDVRVHLVTFGGVALDPALYPSMLSVWCPGGHRHDSYSTVCPFPRVWDVLRAPDQLRHRWFCSSETVSSVIMKCCAQNKNADKSHESPNLTSFPSLQRSRLLLRWLASPLQWLCLLRVGTVFLWWFSSILSDAGILSTGLSTFC